jgi:hypothetical protein
MIAKQSFQSLRLEIMSQCTTTYWLTGISLVRLDTTYGLGQNCILNSTERLTIGNGVGIGTYSCVWTHGFHGELLEGCKILKLAPTVIEDDVLIVGSYNIVSPGAR